MPCRCDHMEPSARETESQLVCQLLVYLKKKTGAKLPRGVIVASKNMYGNISNVDRDTDVLCSILAATSDKIIYNGRDKNARKLADWWDDHKKRDRRRAKEDRSAKKHKKLVKSALSQLPQAERDAIQAEMI